MSEKANSVNHKAYYLKFYIFILMYVLTAALIIYFAFKFNFKAVSGFTAANADVIEETNNKPATLKVIIDAGHGGIDGGATGINEAVEKDLNLAISAKLKELFSLSDVEVIMTRETDEMLNDEAAKKRKASDLSNRVKIAKNFPDAVFVSIHMNTYPKEKFYGMQVFYSPNNIESAKLALKIQEFNKTYLQPEINREVKRGKNIYVLENIDNCAVLIECGFISNRTEADKLADSRYQNRLAFVIYNSILSYLDT